MKLWMDDVGTPYIAPGMVKGKELVVDEWEVRRGEEGREGVGHTSSAVAFYPLSNILQSVKSLATFSNGCPVILLWYR